MTDLPPTEVDEIVVTGQRRRPGGTFPSRGSSSGGAGDGGIRVDEPNPQNPAPEDSGPPDPCADPETARDWNADAAVAAAAQEFARLAALAGEDGFEYRERGAWIIMLPDGRIGFGPVLTGDPFDENGDGWVNAVFDGVDPMMVIGFAHTHRQGQHRPSGSSPRPWLEGGDVGAFYELQRVMRTQGRDPNLAREYIIARNEVGAGQTPYNQINVYNHTNIEASQTEFKEGPEVNPDGQPCP